MSIPVIAFFNNKGGVGKTSLIYHLAWMYSDLGLRVLAADLDPQANLTAAFLDEDRLEELWAAEGSACRTVFQAVKPLISGTGDIKALQPELVVEGLGNQPLPLSTLDDPSERPLALLAGDLALSSFEDDLSTVWPQCLSGNERAFRVTSAFWRIAQQASEKHRSDLILVDVGPNLGAINRAALIAADYVAIPLAPDLFSLQGLRNLGPTLVRWRQDWQDRLKKNPEPDLSLPAGRIEPLGYIVLLHAVRLNRPVKAYDRWAVRIPGEYRRSMLADEAEASRPSPAEDPHCLALLKHYRSLMPLAQDARKPMFHLKPADGALGSHFAAAQDAFADFRRLAEEIASRVGVSLPETPA